MIAAKHIGCNDSTDYNLMTGQFSRTRLSGTSLALYLQKPIASGFPVANAASQFPGGSHLMASSFSNKNKSTGEKIADAAKEMGHKLARGAEKAADFVKEKTGMGHSQKTQPGTQ